MHDADTVAYFDDYTPEYDPGRFRHAVEMLNRLATADSTLVDVGCGTGNTLEYLQRETTLRNFCGIDVSRRCLDKTQERVGCDALQGSILDDEFVHPLQERFDFAVIAAVLHHLVGKTRGESWRFATRAVANTLRLVKPGGHLIIIEPVFYPSAIMSAVFYIKRLVTTMTSDRLEFFGEGNNIGAPVVSYYTTEQVTHMVRAAGTGDVVDTDCVDRPLHILQRLAFIRRSDELTLGIRKRAPAAPAGS